MDGGGRYDRLAILLDSSMTIPRGAFLLGRKYSQMEAASHDEIIQPADLPGTTPVTLVWSSLSHTSIMVDAEMTASARPVMLSPTH